MDHYESSEIKIHFRNYEQEKCIRWSMLFTKTQSKIFRRTDQNNKVDEIIKIHNWKTREDGFAAEVHKY